MIHYKFERTFTKNYPKSGGPFIYIYGQRLHWESTYSDPWKSLLECLWSLWRYGDLQKSVLQNLKKADDWLYYCKIYIASADG